MLQEATELTNDVSVLRRLLFAVTTLNTDTPDYWGFVTNFGFKSSSFKPPCDKVKLALENLKYLDADAFSADTSLLQEMICIKGFKGHPLGIVLISENDTCKVCGGALKVRSDRPSFPVIYTEELGSVEGTHFRKYCARGCSFTQHYGHILCHEETIYDQNCLDLPYFLATNMTGFETKMLKKFSAELLLGQISYRQRSEIYNYTHEYDCGHKEGDRSIISQVGEDVAGVTW